MCERGHEPLLVLFGLALGLGNSAFLFAMGGLLAPDRQLKQRHGRGGDGGNQQHACAIEAGVHRQHAGGGG